MFIKKHMLIEEIDINFSANGKGGGWHFVSVGA